MRNVDEHLFVLDATLEECAGLARLMEAICARKIIVIAPLFFGVMWPGSQHVVYGLCPQ